MPADTFFQQERGKDHRKNRIEKGQRHRIRGRDIDDPGKHDPDTDPAKRRAQRMKMQVGTYVGQPPAHHQKQDQRRHQPEGEPAVRDLQRMDGIPEITAAEQFGCEGTAGKEQRCGNGDEKRADIHFANRLLDSSGLLERSQFNRLLELVDEKVIPSSQRLNQHPA